MVRLKPKAVEIRETRFRRTKQPEAAYPRWFFQLVFRRRDGKKEKWPIFAYSTALAEKQGRNLAELKGWELLKIDGRRRVDWRLHAKTGKQAWLARAVQEFNKKDERNA